MILRILWQSGLILALGAAGAVATWKWNPDSPALYLVMEDEAGPNEITLTKALELKNVLWLDARRRSEFEKGHIPGALLLNLYEWEDLMRPVIEAIQENQERTIIIYCDSQRCDSSRELRKRMIDWGLGDFDIRILHGGWPFWKAARK